MRAKDATRQHGGIDHPPAGKDSTMGFMPVTEAAPASAAADDDDLTLVQRVSAEMARVRHAAAAKGTSDDEVEQLVDRGGELMDALAAATPHSLGDIALKVDAALVELTDMLSAEHSAEARTMFLVAAVRSDLLQMDQLGARPLGMAGTMAPMVRVGVPSLSTTTPTTISAAWARWLALNAEAGHKGADDDAALTAAMCLREEQENLITITPAAVVADMVIKAQLLGRLRMEHHQHDEAALADSLAADLMALAPTAAPSTPRGPAEGTGADAELIALCGEYEALQHRYNVELKGIDDEHDTHPVKGPIWRRMTELEEVIPTKEVTTPAGLAAKVRHAFLATAHEVEPGKGPDSTSDDERLALWALVQDAARVAKQPMQVSPPSGASAVAAPEPQHAETAVGESGTSPFNLLDLEDPIARLAGFAALLRSLTTSDSAPKPEALHFLSIGADSLAQEMWRAVFGDEPMRLSAWAGY